MPARARKNVIQSMTVRLPQPLYDQAKVYVHNSSVPSLNDLMVHAVQAFLRAAERRRIDAAFASMAEDSEYQKEVRLIEEEFEQSDWETIEILDQDAEL
jgi:hypothetical protein